MLRNINTVRSGLRVIYRPQTGVLGSLIPDDGDDVPSIMYSQLEQPGDLAHEWSYWVESSNFPTGFWPLDDDGSGTRGPYPQGLYSASVALYRFDVRQFAFPVTLTVGSPPPPSVVTQPTAQSAAVPSPASFAFEFLGATAVQAQRRANSGSPWANVSGATLTGYTTPATSTSDYGSEYRFGATGPGGGPTYTNVVGLTLTTSRPSLVEPVEFLDMLGRVLPYAPDCPPQTAELHLREAATDFFQRTLAWRDDLPELVTVVAQQDYTLVLPEMTAVAKLTGYVHAGRELSVIDAEAGQRLATAQCGDECAWTLDRRSASVNPVPTGAGQVMSFRVALKPSRDATAIPGALYEQYIDHIVDGALARILALPKKTFTDRQAASDHKAAYELAVARVGLMTAKGFSRQRRAPTFLG